MGKHRAVKQRRRVPLHQRKFELINWYSFWKRRMSKRLDYYLGKYGVKW